jgi:septal ring factor EnvC (AmiA/AmiB activator)
MMRRVGVGLASLGLLAFVSVGHAAPGDLAGYTASFATAPSSAPPVTVPVTPGRGSPALALAALDRKIADLDAEEDASKKELAALGSQIATAHTRVVANGRAFYRLTRAGMLPVGGGFQALVTHAIRVERARRALASEVATESHLREHGGDLSRTLERVARDRVALGSQRTAMDAARLAMEDEARRQAAFDRAFSTSSGAGTNDYVAIYGGGGGADTSNVGGFVASRGRLLFPVLGRAEVRPAKREGTDGPGLEVRAAVGTAVRAVFSGRVAFADRYGPYGRLVILDHGDHYYTVSGNLAGIDVKIGDEVSAGERIGSVGDEGRGGMLYFEVRHGTETIPPGPWLGVQ